MADRFVFRAVIFTVLLFFCAAAFAQEESLQEEAFLDEAALEEEEEGAVEDTWQVLEWEEENPKYVLFYEVIIEQFDKKKNDYVEIIRERTEGKETNFSPNPRLDLGQYRFKIVTYNLVGIPETESDYFEFLIVRAHKPKITGISSTVNGGSTIYIEDENDGIFDVSGRNLFLPDGGFDARTEYSLVRNAGKSKITPQILKHEKSGRGIKLQFDMNLLDAGVYNLVALDASGLKNDLSKSSEITVKFKKRFDFDISLGYACPIVIYDTTIPEYMVNKAWPIGVAAKAVFIFSKHKYGYFGVGLSGHYNFLISKQDFYTITGNIVDGYVEGVYQLPIYLKIKNRRRHFMSLEARLGAGLMSFYDFKFEFMNGKTSEPLNGLYFGFDAGLFAQFFINSHFFVEAGFDYVHAFAGDIMFGEIIPSVKAGWKF